MFNPTLAFNLRVHLSPHGESASVELLHLLHAVSLASQILRHGVALATAEVPVRDADVAGRRSAAWLG